MVNQQVLEGHWNELKGKIREKWGQLSESDLPQFRGNIEQLVGIIQRRTGEQREAIENYLNQVTESATSMMGKAHQQFRGYAEQAADQMRGGYIQAERLVRDRPAQALAICFGVGVAIGLLVALTFRSR